MIQGIVKQRARGPRQISYRNPTAIFSAVSIPDKIKQLIIRRVIQLICSKEMGPKCGPTGSKKRWLTDNQFSETDKVTIEQATMRTYDPDQPILYTHIPKCAGSSMRRVLSDWFGKGFHKVNQERTAPFGLPKVPTKDGQGNWLPDVKCIQAHFHHGHGFGLPYFYPEVQQYITIMRDPFDLMVSMYFFMKGQSKEGKFWYRGRPVDISKEIPNIESYLQRYPFWLYSHLPQNLTLANYSQELPRQFVYIGIFEDMQNSIDRLAEKLDKPTTTLPLSNASEYDETVPENLREQFYHDYPLPKRIYDFAVENYLKRPTDDAQQSAAEQVKNREPIPTEAVTGSGLPCSAHTEPVLDDEVVCGDMSPAETT